MDLSTGQNIHETREWIMRNSPIPVRELIKVHLVHYLLAQSSMSATRMLLVCDMVYRGHRVHRVHRYHLHVAVHA